MAMIVGRYGRAPVPRLKVSERARSLRRDGTEAERRLWRALRNRQLVGVKFRRQVAIGPYFADFACIAKKLVVELDGGQHADNKRLDDARTRSLAAQGYRVLRIWNNEVIENIEGVLGTIRSALEK